MPGSSLQILVIPHDNNLKRNIASLPQVLKLKRQRHKWIK